MIDRYTRVAHGDRIKITVHPASRPGQQLTSEVWVHVLEAATGISALVILSRPEAVRLAESLIRASQINRGN